MRTITENLFHRLAAQAQEAEVQGLSKVAQGLTDQMEKHSSLLRHDDDFYKYSEKEFKSDLNSQFWGVIVRMADFYGVRKFDAAEFQNIIEIASESLLEDFKNLTKVSHGVGAYEEAVLGEVVEKVDIEVEEEE